MPHHFKALHTLSKLMFLGVVIYLLGGFGFFLSHLLAIQSTVTAVVVVNLCAWLGYVYLGVSWAWGHKVSRNKVVAITGLDTLNFILLSVSLAWSSILMMIFLVRHHWARPGPGLQPHEDLPDNLARFTGLQRF